MLTCVSSVSSSVASHQWTVSDRLWLVSLVISVCNRVLCELTLSLSLSLSLSQKRQCVGAPTGENTFNMILDLKQTNLQLII